MAKTIQDFIAQVSQKSVAKVGHFDVFIAGPAQLGLQVGVAELAFRTNTIEIPGRQVASLNYRTYGPIQKVAYDQLHNDVAMTVMLSSDFFEKQFFQRWQDMATGLARGTITVAPGLFDIGYYDNYKGDVQINQYDDKGTQVYKCHLVEAWPATITPLTADWSNDDYHRLQVSFAYRYFIDDDGFAESFTSQSSQENSGDPDTSGDLVA